MFWETLTTLCARNGISVSKLCSLLELSNSISTKWKRGALPNNSTMKKIADYFGVSTEYLTGAVPVSEVAMVPIYGRVAAGAGMFADDEIIGEQPIFSAMVKNIGECFCLRVSGDSMLPRIQDGDIILVRKQTSVDSGAYAVVLIDDENGVVKKVKYDSDSVTLISINPNYPPRTFSGADLERLTVLGEVIQIISTLK